MKIIKSQPLSRSGGKRGANGQGQGGQHLGAREGQRRAYRSGLHTQGVADRKLLRAHFRPGPHEVT